MAGGGGGAVGMRLNVMTALYLPILLYAMSTFDLDKNALVLDGENLKPHIVAENTSVAVGDTYEASIMFTLQNETQAMGAGKDEKGGGEALFVPEIELDPDKSPDGLRWDPVEKRLVMDTDKLFANESSDTYTKEVSFAGTIRGKTAKDIKDGRPPSYVESISGSFNVFRPTIQVQSNAVPKLYSQCRNSLSFTVPGVSTTDLMLKNKFTGSSTDGNSLTFSPSGDTTAIAVYRKTGEGENKLGEKGFKITSPPPPSVGLRRVGENKFMAPSEQIDLFGQFELVIKADPNFANEYQDDAKYRIKQVRFELARTGLAPLEGEMSTSDLRNRLDSQKAGQGEFVYPFELFEVINNPQGTGLNIFVEELVRVNYRGTEIPLDPTVVPTQFSFKAF